MFFKIGEVARITGLEPYVLRYWETEFPQISPRKGGGGQREYRREDVQVIVAIQTMLRRDGYTISGAKRKLRQQGAAALDTVQPALQQATKPAPEKPRKPVPSSQGKALAEAVLRASEGGLTSATVAPAAELIQKTEKGLRELLQLMDNTDSFRVSKPESGRGAVR